MRNLPKQLDLFIPKQFEQNAQNVRNVLEQLHHEYIAPVDAWGTYDVTRLYLEAYNRRTIRSPSENTLLLLSHPDQDLVGRYIRAACYNSHGKTRFREYGYPPGCTLREFQHPTGDNELESKVTLFWDEIFSNMRYEDVYPPVNTL